MNCHVRQNLIIKMPQIRVTQQLFGHRSRRAGAGERAVMQGRRRSPKAQRNLPNHKLRGGILCVRVRRGDHACRKIRITVQQRELDQPALFCAHGGPFVSVAWVRAAAIIHKVYNGNAVLYTKSIAKIAAILPAVSRACQTKPLYRIVMDIPFARGNRVAIGVVGGVKPAVPCEAVAVPVTENEIPTDFMRLVEVEGLRDGNKNTCEHHSRE
jgi:hypothetical protein